MYRKWLGWKKVAVCLVGAAMVMQGASMTMAADEYPTEQNEPDYANEDQTAEDTAEGSTDSDEDSEDQSTSDEDTDEDTSDEDTLHEETDEDTSDEDSDSVADVVIDPEETPEESEDVIAAEEDGEDAESVGLLVTGTVSHIDLSRVAEATLTVGDKTLTQTVVFDEGDLGNITVDPDYAGAIILGEGQIHIAGVFPVGTFDNRVQYTVSITKDVTFTDPDTGATYTQINQPQTSPGICKDQRIRHCSDHITPDIDSGFKNLFCCNIRPLFFNFMQGSGNRHSYIHDRSQ